MKKLAIGERIMIDATCDLEGDYNAKDFLDDEGFAHEARGVIDGYRYNVRTGEIDLYVIDFSGHGYSFIDDEEDEEDRLLYVKAQYITLDETPLTEDEVQEIFKQAHVTELLKGVTIGDDELTPKFTAQGMQIGCELIDIKTLNKLVPALVEYYSIGG